MAALWSVLALSGTLAAEARRGSLEFVATTPLGMRRIAVEKLAAHLTGMAIVVIVTFLSAYLAGSAFATLPGDEIPVSAALGFALWVGVVALASGAVAFALSPLIGRGASAGIAGAILVAGYFINGYQAAVPAFAGVANLTWWGWTAHHQPLAGAVRLGVPRPGRDRRDRPVRRGRRAVRAPRPGPDVARPVAGHPRRAHRPPRSDQPLAGRAPAAGGVVGDRDRPDGLHLRGRVAVADRCGREPVARHPADLPQPVPEPRAQRGRRVPPAGVHHVRVDPGRVRGGDPRQRLGDRRDRRPPGDAALDADVPRPVGALERPRRLPRDRR